MVAMMSIYVINEFTDWIITISLNTLRNAILGSIFDEITHKPVKQPLKYD